MHTEQSDHTEIDWTLVDHWHNETLCEHCLTKLVMTGNPFIDSLKDWSYMGAQLMLIAFSALVQFLAHCRLEIFRASRAFLIALGLRDEYPIATLDHTHLPGQQVCERCLGSLSSSGWPLMDALSEQAHMAWEAVLIVAQLIGITILGIGMCIATIFPNAMRAKTPHEREIERRDHEQRRREWTEMERQNKLAQECNKGDLGRGSDSDEIFQDDLRVRAINNVVRGVEDGTEDPEKLKQMTRELKAYREECARRDERKREAAQKCKTADALALQWYEEAEKAFACGDIDAGYRARKKAHAFDADADFHYRQFHNL